MKCDICGEEGHATEEFSDKLCILQYMHCKLCVEELPRGKSMEEWAHLAVGFTKQGVQVWCERHECNVMHLDFEGTKHPAILSRHQDA